MQLNSKGKILIAGGTGFVGKSIVAYLLEKGYSINVLSRKAKHQPSAHLTFFEWDLQKEWIDAQAFEDVTAIINLTGANIGAKKWSKKRKKEIVESRVIAIELLYKYTQKSDLKIDVFISSSAVGYYGTVTEEEVFTENTSIGKDFLAKVCLEWEENALKFNELANRTVVLRKGVVIGEDGGMYQKLKPLMKRGLGVVFGDGYHYLPWIDVRDLARLYAFVLEDEKVNGIFNTVASEHITMNDFSSKMAQSLKSAIRLPNLPRFLIKILFGEMAVMLLEGSRVSNEKLLATGFEFKYNSIDDALQIN